MLPTQSFINTVTHPALKFRYLDKACRNANRTYLYIKAIYLPAKVGSNIPKMENFDKFLGIFCAGVKK